MQRRRRSRGLTQEALAGAIGFDRKSINRLEKGTHSMTLDRVWAVADALEVTVGDLERDAADIASERALRSRR